MLVDVLLGVEKHAAAPHARVVDALFRRRSRESREHTGHRARGVELATPHARGIGIGLQQELVGRPDQVRALQVSRAQLETTKVTDEPG